MSSSDAGLSNGAWHLWSAHCHWLRRHWVRLNWCFLAAEISLIASLTRIHWKPNQKPGETRDTSKNACYHICTVILAKLTVWAAGGAMDWDEMNICLSTGWNINVCLSSSSIRPSSFLHPEKLFELRQSNNDSLFHRRRCKLMDQVLDQVSMKFPVPTK